jgi:hypothetical protein
VSGEQNDELDEELNDELGDEVSGEQNDELDEELNDELVDELGVGQNDEQQLWRGGSGARHLSSHGPVLPEGSPQPDHEVLLPGENSLEVLNIQNILNVVLIVVSNGSYLQ